MIRPLTFPWRKASLLPLLFCLVVLAGDTPCVQGSVIIRPAKIVFSTSDDFPEMDFVVYELKPDDPWAKGPPVNPAAAKIVPAGSDAVLPESGGVAVLAVPRSLAEKAKGKADAAWLEPSASGVIRIPGSFRVPHVYRDVTLRYRLEKGDKGPRLVLLDEDVLKSAKQEPADTSAEVPKSQPLFLTQPVFLWGLVAGGCVGLLLGICFAWLAKRGNEAATNRLP